MLNDQQKLHPHALIRASVDVIFGRPSEDCPGHGICRMEATEHPFIYGQPCSPCAQRAVAALAIYDRLNERLSLLIDRGKLGSEQWATYFTDTYFRMEESYRLSASVRGALSIEGEASLPAGNYAFQVTQQTVCVHFPLCYANQRFVNSASRTADKMVSRYLQQSRAGMPLLVQLQRTTNEVALGNLGPYSLRTLKQGAYFLASCTIDHRQRLSLHLSEKELPAYFTRSIRRKGQLDVPAKLTLPAPLAYQLGLAPGHWTIPAGKLPVLKVADQFTISLPLQVAPHRATEWSQNASPRVHRYA
ncbi:MAG: hypothetical protein AAF828_11745 [Bacteroidota bacterium]